MSKFTIKSGSYCPACRGMTLCDCTHTMDELRSALSGGPQFAAKSDALAARLAEATAAWHDRDTRLLAMEARLAEEVKNKKEFERDWLAACDELCNTRSRLAEAEKWRDYYRAQWFGPQAVTQPEPPPDSASVEGKK